MYLLVLFIFLVLLAESLAYLWHRYGAHSQIDLTGAGKIHQWHHQVKNDPAHYDFAYALLFLVVYGLGLAWLFRQNLLSRSLGLVLYLPFVLVSFWNWYVHAAYHSPGHWLEQYSWFLRDRELHWQHHRNPEVNYGIASHFGDILGDTFGYGFSLDQC